MAAVKTVKVFEEKGSKVINATDFDPEKHTLFTTEKPKPKAQPTRKQKKTN